MGRPPKYKTANEMQKDIDKYFESVTFINPDTGHELIRPTVEGLAYALNMDRSTLIEYGKNGEFSNTVKRAKQKVAIALENHLWGNNVTGAIFNLKNNFGWKDKQEVEQSGVTVVKIKGEF